MANNLKRYLVLPEDKWRPIMLRQHSRIATLRDIENAFVGHPDGFALHELFLRSCMGHFLLMHQEMHFCSKIVNSLLQRHIERPNAHRNEMHFLLGSIDVCLSREEFCLITGLKFGQAQKPTGYDKTHEGGLIHRHFPDHEQIRVPDLICCLREGEFDEGMDIMKLSVLIMKHNFLWGTDIRTVVFTFEVAPDIASLARRRPNTAHLPRICHWEFAHSLNYPKTTDAKEPKLFLAQVSSIV
ncbi:Hypothetical predicted protein [Olea europaea subsp. europaea]|uniref:DUF1985 domain-containing protein n=1 Tax=Olea europaea subsp. europaea TaxID=158383 RepID=A0A8S0UWW6_OLEEU|nr:Hypothetical predicted protein [Olea europaea subsp. europaea]